MRFTGPISFITRIADAPRIGPAKLKAIPTRAQLAASAHREQLSTPYFYRASGLAQTAVSALLRASSADARKVLAAEHCRYGTRDVALIESQSGLSMRV
jgi:protein tyrosine phosphatase (PTP) superfamily phosphohydrolase (DUF442 family)